MADRPSGGKSFALIIDPLRYKHVPGFGAVLFCRTIPEITRESGMWDEMRNIYPQFCAAANQVDRKWTLPSGAKITLSGFFGLYLSYFADISSGASIVLVSTLFFIVVYLRKKFFNGKNRLAKRD